METLSSIQQAGRGPTTRVAQTCQAHRKARVLPVVMAHAKHGAGVNAASCKTISQEQRTLVQTHSTQSLPPAPSAAQKPTGANACSVCCLADAQSRAANLQLEGMFETAQSTATVRPAALTAACTDCSTCDCCTPAGGHDAAQAHPEIHASAAYALLATAERMCCAPNWTDGISNHNSTKARRHLRLVKQTSQSWHAVCGRQLA
jgi:hypothetical protein